MRANILVIDDDPIMRQLASTILSREGYAVEVVDSVAEAIESLGRNLPDVVLCDLILPATPGIEFLKHRQATPGLSQIPVIAFSASGETQMMADARVLGAYAVLSKPFSPKQMVAVVAAALASRRP